MNSPQPGKIYDGYDAAADGRPASANPHVPETSDYYFWHAAWCRAMRAAAVKARDHRSAQQYEKLAENYFRMAKDAGAL